MIVLSKLLGTYPSTRKSVDELFKKINSMKAKNIIIDFNNVFGITHSFAAQYIYNKNNCTKSIKEINKNENVNSMFNVIGKHKKIELEKNIPIEDFTL